MASPGLFGSPPPEPEPTSETAAETTPETPAGPPETEAPPPAETEIGPETAKTASAPEAATEQPTPDDPAEAPDETAARTADPEPAASPDSSTGPPGAEPAPHPAAERAAEIEPIAAEPEPAAKPETPSGPAEAEPAPHAAVTEQPPADDPEAAPEEIVDSAGGPEAAPEATEPPDDERERKSEGEPPAAVAAASAGAGVDTTATSPEGVGEPAAPAPVPGPADAAAEPEPAAPPPDPLPGESPTETAPAAASNGVSEAPPETSAAPAPVATTTDSGSEDAGGGYEVLALRYRPQTFSDLIGQEPIARTLQNAIRRDRVSHAFLFSGQRGIGKTTTARILAKALNCSANEGPNPEPCGGCPSCREIAGGFSRDVPEIDGASNNSVEKAREIIETAHYTPVRDRFKIYLVDEVHMLSTGAFNALLKTLEEPPKHVKFIFATTEVHKIPDTILSRCQEFEFRAVTPERVQERLRFIVERQGFSVSEEALAQIARFGQGSMRDAISALDQVLAAVDGEVTATEVSELLGVPDVTICRRAAAAILEGDRRAVFEVVAELVSGGRDLKHFVTLFMHYLRDVVVCRAAPDRPNLLEWPDERAALTAFAEKFSEEDLLRSLDVLTRAQDGLRWSPEPRFHLEMALLKLVEMPRLAAFETLLERLETPPPAGAAGDRGTAGPAEPSPAPQSLPPPAGGAAAVPAASRAGNGAAARRPDPGPRANGADSPPAASSAGSDRPPPEIPEIVKEYQRTFGGQIIPISRTPNDTPENAAGA